VIQTKSDKVRVAVDALNAGDFDGYARAFSPGCVRWTSGFGDATLEESLAQLSELRTKFSGFRLDAKLLLESGDHVVARWVNTGTHTGNFGGIPRTDRAILIDACEVYEFTGDVITRTWAYCDPLELPRQLGAVPELDAG
jgi:predicted ester cyclase